MKRAVLEQLTVKQLRDLALEHNIEKASRLLKEELISALLLRTEKTGKGQKNSDKIKAVTRKIVTRTKNAATRPSTRTRKRISSTAPKSSKGKKLSPPASVVENVSASSLRVGAPPVQYQQPIANPGLPIPEHYGRDRLVLMVQDPLHIFAYWELQGDTVARAMNETHGGSPVLVVRCDGHSESREVDLRGGNYYLAVKPDSRYEAELALRSNNGQLFTLARSNSVQTPLPAVSTRLDEQWMSTQDHFSDLLDLAGLPESSDADSYDTDSTIESFNSTTRLRMARALQRKTTWNWDASSVTALTGNPLSSTALTTNNRSSSARLDVKKA
jgi:hypothetical protein